MSVDSNYIKWVQRSLNRIMKTNMVIDGTRHTTYLDVLSRFKDMNDVDERGLTSDQIGPKCQDLIIRINNAGNSDGGDYLAWLCSVLPGAPTSASAVTNGLESAVRAFQKSEKLKVDGWVGYKTEQRLIEKFKKDPPGTREGDTPQGGGKPSPWVEWFNTLPLEKRYKHMMEIAAKDYATAPKDARIKCLSQKLRATERGVPFNYYFTAKLVQYLCWGDPPKSAALDSLKKHIKPPDSIFGYAYYDLRDEQVKAIVQENFMVSSLDKFYWYYSRRFSSMEDYNYNYQKFYRAVEDLHHEIDKGIGEIQKLRNRTHGEPTMKLAQSLVASLAKSKFHIYSCYKDQMPGEWWQLEGPFG